MPLFPRAVPAAWSPVARAAPAFAPTLPARPPNCQTTAAAAFAAYREPVPPRPVRAADPATAPACAAVEADQPRPGSLLGARIAGARAILREGADEEDDVLLLAANALHQKAVAHPDDADAQAASLTLWRAEAQAWAAANGAAPSLDEATRLQAYLDLWKLALDPPAPPAFLTRRDVAREYLLERARTGQSIAIAATPSMQAVPVEALVDHYMETPEVRVRYYGQFADYVNAHLDHFSKLSAIADAAAAGVHRLRLEEVPRRMWHISSLIAYPAGAHKLPSGALLDTLGRSLGPSYVAEMADGEFLHIDAGGKVARLGGTVANEAGQLDPGALLRSLGLVAPPASPASAASAPGPLPGHAAPADAATPARPRPAAEYIVNHAPCAPVTLRAHIVTLRRVAVLGAIQQWKTDNYLPSRMETVLRLIVPFYAFYHQMKWDPGYEPQLGDVAWDAAALAITLALIAVTAGGGSAGIAAAHISMRAVAAQGARAMMAAGMRSLLQQFHLRVLLVSGARELTDFVVPIFSAARLLGSAARVTPLAARALKGAALRANTALRTANARLLLDGIYELVARGNTAHRNVSAATIRQSLEAAARRPVPMRVYHRQDKGSSGTMLMATMDPYASADDILAAIIRHAACGAGPGPLPSLTGARDASPESARAAPGTGAAAPHVIAIDTTAAPGKFRNLEDILVNDGPRLVQEGRLPSAILRSAITQALARKDERIFYIGGRIPDALILGRDAAASAGAPAEPSCSRTCTAASASPSAAAPAPSNSPFARSSIRSAASAPTDAPASDRYLRSMSLRGMGFSGMPRE